MNRLKEIELRLAEIASTIETRGAELKSSDLDALEKEVKELKEERTALKAGIQQRQNLLASIADDDESSKIVRSFNHESASEDKYDSLEYRKAFMEHVCRGKVIPVEFRADEVSKTTDVGAAIPTTVLNRVIEKLEKTGMILKLVTKTAYKGGVAIPTSSVKPVATWTAESNGSQKQKKALDGSITFAYHKLRCAVAVSLEVEIMSLSAFEATLTNNILEAMTKAIEQAIVSGTGVGQPKGILTETVPTARKIKSVKPSYQDLVEAEAALPEAYENGAVWCMSKKTFMQYYGMTDANNQPIARVNYGIGGKPERILLGRTVVTCDYVTSYSASLAAGTKFGFLFNFSDYALNTNYNMGIKKYVDNDTDDTINKAIMIVDGKVIDSGSLVTIEKSAS